MDPLATQCYITVSLVTSVQSLIFILQPSESWSPPNDPCVKYDCQKENDELIISKKQTTCPEFDPTKCVPVSIFFLTNNTIFHSLKQYNVTHGFACYLNSHLSHTLHWTPIYLTGNWTNWSKWLLQNMYVFCYYSLSDTLKHSILI